MEATTTRARGGRAEITAAPLGERELEALRPLGQRYVRSHFGAGLSSQDAEDVVAEVIARLFERLERGEESRNLNALFFTSVHNASVDLLRRRDRRPEVALEAAADAESGAPAPVDRALTSETGALVRDVLTRIRPRYREALALRFGVGLNTVEIAAHKRISVTAAKKLVNRAAHQTELELAKLRQGHHCSEAQRLIRDGLFSDAVTDGAQQREPLARHLAHCGACKSFLSELKGLHELAGTALLTGSAADGLTRRAGLVDHLSAWGSSLGDGAHAAADRARVIAFKAGQHLTSADGASAGALTGTAKQITAFCATGAAAATCLATGIVGPGIAAHPSKPTADQPPKVDTTPAPATDPTNATPPPPSSDPAAAPSPAPSEPAKPVQQTNRELGLGSSTSSPSSGSRDFAAPIGSASSSGGGGSDSGSGGFGFEK